MVKMKFITGALLAVWLCTIPAEQTVAQSFREAFKQAARDALNGKRSIYRYGQSKQTDPVLPKIALKCESKEEAKALANYLREHLQVPVIVQKKTCNVITNMSKKELQTWIEKYKASLNQNKTSTNSSTQSSNTEKQTTDTTTVQKGKVISLIVNGEAPTKEEATQIALRSAIEQTFGTFVSANTEVLNDEITKDEIATIASGNIQSYQELSCIDLANGNKSVSLQAVVSIDKLVSYAQSKGMTAELAGATFAMNIKMKELNRKNEAEAMKNMVKQLEEIVETGLCDFELITKSPRLTTNNLYEVELTINAIANSNTLLFYQTYHETMKKLSLSASERKEYIAANLPIYRYRDYPAHDPLQYNQGTIEPYITRNPLDLYDSYINYLIIKGCCSFSITDNNSIRTITETSSDSIKIGSQDNLPRFRMFGGNYLNFHGFQENGDAILPKIPYRRYIGYYFGIKNNEKILRTRCLDINGNSGGSGSFLHYKIHPLQNGTTIFTWYIYINYTLDELSKVSSFKVNPYRVKFINRQK